MDHVLSKSVESFLERSNYNKTGELAAAITDVGLDTKRVKPLFKDLQEMMNRRHLIVHRVDRNPKAGKGHHRAQSLGAERVKPWVDVVQRFADEILKQIP